MLWNITEDEIKVRQVINSRDTWPRPESSGNHSARGQIAPITHFVKTGDIKYPGIDEIPSVPEFGAIEESKVIV